MDEPASLSHTKWECKYHVIFIPKRRREDVVCGAAQTPGGVVSQISFAKGKPDRRRSPYARSRAYVDFDPTEIRGVTGGWIHQGKERDPSGQGVRREETEFCRSTLLGLFVSTVGRDETSIRCTPGLTFHLGPLWRRKNLWPRSVDRQNSVSSRRIPWPD